ncbi:MAG: hypothetical protein Q8K90_03580 [Brevundimonas sp.]|nr:hypothetical protein [Brevundimonas sp.]
MGTRRRIGACNRLEFHCLQRFAAGHNAVALNWIDAEPRVADHII